MPERGPKTGPEIGVVDSLAAVDRAQWDALFAQTLEGYDYLLAVERAGLEGFRWRYVLASEDGVLIAAVPAFLTDYAVETTLTGPGKRAIEATRRVLPGFLTLGLACLGSPCTTTASLGLAPQVAQADRPALLRALLAAFEADARANGCGLFASKDVVADDKPLWDAAARPLGYRPMASLPIAGLDIDFPDMDAYFARLSYSARKDMRRKLRVLDGLRIEVRADADPFADRLMALYEQTRARAEMSFEHLTAGYFLGVPRQMPGRAFWVLYFEGEDLLAANLLVQDETTLLDKYFLMDAARGRALNLYFVSWFTNLRLCLERGLKHYRSGQAAYENKLRLGSNLTRTSIYFRHRNPVFNAVMQLFAPLFAADPTAGEIT
ncbi:peptidogalycan biosysnthesis protein [Phenylobacterium sp.]|uniref:peptidogalycan biosysnthesis protein n=1 Tax=Phenylobacterium sp. TaxID=1871053 RepID=UPI002BF2924B|nr:peptidogalycan biosysnthesis protein [Phenylobacterium sp.]HLZ74185.1 peptidogalycan biosysnthesis protein [Phenylobacterium sp.]